MRFHGLNDEAQLLVKLLGKTFDTCFSLETARVQLHAKDAESEISANKWNFVNITPYTTEDHVNGR